MQNQYGTVTCGSFPLLFWYSLQNRTGLHKFARYFLLAASLLAAQLLAGVITRKFSYSMQICSIIIVHIKK